MDRLGSLSAFMQAAETRSFTAAGRQLGVSSSAIGKSIARLEERLGVRLFHRSTRSITLTPEGALFLDRCQRIFGEIEAAEMELSLASSAPRGRLRVSLPLIGMLLMPAIGDFVRAFPEVELDLDFSDRMVDVIEEGFDVVIRSGDLSDSRLMMRILGTFSFKVIGSAAYLAERGTPEIPEDLLGHACLRHRFPSTGKLEKWPFRPKPDTEEIEVPVTAVASTLEPLISLAEQGLGLICVPDFTVRRQIEAGSLRFVLEPHMEAGGTFRILWPSGRNPSPKVKAFVDFMSQRLFPKKA